MTIAKKPATVRRALVIAAAAGAIGFGALSVFAARHDAGSNSNGFVNRIERMTALCAPGNSARRCRRWRSG